MSGREEKSVLLDQTGVIYFRFLRREGSSRVSPRMGLICKGGPIRLLDVHLDLCLLHISPQPGP
jgi:hypothetical protein